MSTGMSTGSATTGGGYWSFITRAPAALPPLLSQTQSAAHHVRGDADRAHTSPPHKVVANQLTDALDQSASLARGAGALPMHPDAGDDTRAEAQTFTIFDGLSSSECSASTRSAATSVSSHWSPRFPAAVPNKQGGLQWMAQQAAIHSAPPGSPPAPRQRERAGGDAGPPHAAPAPAQSLRPAQDLPPWQRALVRTLQAAAAARPPTPFCGRFLATGDYVAGSRALVATAYTERGGGFQYALKFYASAAHFDVESALYQHPSVRHIMPQIFCSSASACTARGATPEAHLVLERGVSLQSALGQGCAEVVAGVFLELARHLERLHAAGLVHWRLQPSALLLMQQTRGWKLTGLESSKHVGARPPPPDATQNACRATVACMRANRTRRNQRVRFDGMTYLRDATLDVQATSRTRPPR